MQFAGYGPGNPCMATLQKNDRITAADHFQDTRHIEFDLGENGPSHDPGDIITIFPAQDETAISSLFTLLQLDAGSILQLELNQPSQSSMSRIEVSKLLLSLVP